MRIYLDHNATTPVRDEVVEAMLPVLRERFGNPSSTHAFGAEARADLERARARVAALLGAAPEEVIFTAGATEANNAAIGGLLRRRAARQRQAVTTTIEHPSVAEPFTALESDGWQIRRVRVDAGGRVDPEEVAAAITEQTALVSVMWANNETGVIQPIEAIAEIAAARGCVLHVDATQAVGKVPVDLGRVPIDLLSASAHKLNGPKGAGCLVVRGDLGLDTWIRGGPQERRRRGGTQNVAGIVGFGVACELAARELAARADRCRALRDRLWRGIRAKVPRVRRNGSEEHVLPNTLNVEFEGAAGDVLLEAFDLEGVAVSAGAACASGLIEPSPVLVAMGRSPAAARGSLRFSVGEGVDEAQIDHVVALLPDLVQRAREVVSA
ncbi:MAG: cysteine desulfurase [Deltaproteobacteria bacterium]|nr:MAG: cysteine desulfurase [Deltaproteobacteria bacterium]